jgi:hypothetical protein
MALTYAEQATLTTNTAWQGRVQAAVADVAQAQIATLTDTAPNALFLRNLAVQAVSDDSLTTAFCRLVAGGLPPAVNLATPVEATATDAQLRTQVRTAFDALALRR